MADKEILETWRWAAQHYHDLWLLFAIVSAAVVGFAFTDTYKDTKTWVRLALSSLFILFAISNWFSLLAAKQLTEKALDRIKDPLVETMKASPWTVWFMLSGHIAFAVLISVVLWKSPKNPTAKTQKPTASS